MPLLSGVTPFFGRNRNPQKWPKIDPKMAKIRGFPYSKVQEIAKIGKFSKNAKKHKI